MNTLTTAFLLTTSLYSGQTQPIFPDKQTCNQITNIINESQLATAFCTKIKANKNYITQEKTTGYFIITNQHIKKGYFADAKSCNKIATKLIKHSEDAYCTVVKVPKSFFTEETQ